MKNVDLSSTMSKSAFAEDALERKCQRRAAQVQHAHIAHFAVTASRFASSMTFGTLQHGHTRQRGPEQACTHAPLVRQAFRHAGSRRQHSRGQLCVCLGVLDRFVGSTKIREKDLVQMGPLKV